MSSDKQVYATDVSPTLWARLPPEERQSYELHAKYVDELFRIPGVHGVGINTDGEYRLIVLIRQNSTALAKSLVPQELDGCKVKIVEASAFRLAANTDRIRPLQGPPRRV